VLETFGELSPLLQVICATGLTWGLTALGAGVVLFFKKINKNLLDGMLGFAAGVMIAASIWSLIIPSIDISENLKINGLLFLTLGFIAGCLVIFITDNVFRKIYVKENEETKTKRVFLLISSITLHNIPEGLAIGVAFGALTHNIEGASLAGAIALAIGIGLQNFPEGAAVSLPLRREGYSRWKALFYGQLSGAVEPISGIMGLLLITRIQYLLPFFLSFAAGAMMFVVVLELIPESQTNRNKDVITIYTMIGFLLMMLLDIALG
jgi:zinc transporter, ZIP family